ncbi:MAG TPA: hypothetical protein VFP84_08540 [Kofleriaceae bacterium]|nr:hypothetical protein [Kofleriaceae bacterium]
MRLPCIAALALAACAPAPVAPAPAPASRLFDLRSSFWLDLHQRLYAESSAPAARQHAPPQDGAERFTPAERATWDAALAFYRRWLAERDFLTELTPPLVALNDHLHHQRDPSRLDAAGLDPALAAQLTAAAAVYRAHGWPADDRANRAWLAELAPRLAAHGEGFARALSAIYGAPWPAQPIAVEVAPYVGSVGAYTADDPPRQPLITITSATPSYAGDAALEQIFHEASHVLVHDLEAAIAREAAGLGRPVPDGLWHAIIFFTAGELTRRAVPGYVPYADREHLYGPRAHWDVYRAALAAHWQPFLDGAIDRRAALHRLVDAVTRALAPPA